jgi:hypothetical protein
VPAFYLAQGIQAVHAGQTDIQNDKIGRGVSDKCQGVLGIGSGMDLVACLLQMKCQTPAHERIVVNKQNGSRHGNSLHLNEFAGYACRSGELGVPISHRDQSDHREVFRGWEVCSPKSSGPFWCLWAG